MTQHADIYRLLEQKMLSYPDYASVPVTLNDEPLVPILQSATLIARQIGADMRAYTGEQVFVRQSVLARLGRAASCLAEHRPGSRLEVVYGYRALSVQRRLFEQYKAELQDVHGGDDLMAATHRLIAVPDVAGHPTGGAIDVQIVRQSEALDFGTQIWEFVPDSFTFSPFISREAWAHRQLLRQVMLTAGFAPFDGEWWHFSYGDKEWARYYDKPAAIYKQVEFVSDSRD